MIPKAIFKKIILSGFILLCLNNVAFVFAATDLPIPSDAVPGGTGGGGILTQPTGAAPGGTGSGATSAPRSSSSGPLRISEPPSHGLPGSSGVQGMIDTIVNNLLSFVAIIAIVAFVFAAIQFLLAQGRADAIGKAKKNIFGIILGFAILMFAWSIVYIILQFLGFSR